MGKIKTLIIAEAGVNHNGDLDIATKLVDEAADCGADYVKFQTFSARRLVTGDTEKADYQKQSTQAEEGQYEMIRKLELDMSAHMRLIDHCNKRGIQFFSTAFDHESLNILETINMPCFKIPSGEITNLPYLRHIGRLGKPIILSTGMANMGEIESAISILESVGMNRESITVLHCNSEYPTPMKDVNLRAMSSIANAFGVKIGYSDHTSGIEIAIAAVALGATVIEKHLTLDRNLPGPDHKASIEPEEFASMVSAIRNVELAMGDGIKRPSPSEKKNIRVARKSLVASKAIKEGDYFSPENITSKRPGTGISPMRFDEVVGKRATREYLQDELIEL